MDVFDEYQDAEIVCSSSHVKLFRLILKLGSQFEALRRVHLLPSHDVVEDPEEVNVNVFRDLDSSVSEGGDNFSAG